MVDVCYQWLKFATVEELPNHGIFGLEQAVHLFNRSTGLAWLNLAATAFATAASIVSQGRGRRSQRSYGVVYRKLQEAVFHAQIQHFASNLNAILDSQALVGIKSSQYDINQSTEARLWVGSI